MQYTDAEAALIGGLISTYFFQPAVSASLKDATAVFWSTCIRMPSLLLTFSRSERL